MKKVYVVCPECGSIEDLREKTNWYDVFKMYVKSKIKIDPQTGEIDFQEEEDDVIEHVDTTHDTCFFSTRNYTSEDFTVVIEDGQIKEVGEYWKSDQEALCEILERAEILK